MRFAKNMNGLSTFSYLSALDSRDVVFLLRMRKRWRVLIGIGETWAEQITRILRGMPCIWERHVQVKLLRKPRASSFA